ncbi:hypothetical protein DFP72DRAFT_554654 [Ephemerocybe angulata]|uniref:Uncharacterized protein n=1 Tax=Ephemerocybe angulata TaxID=980116 RepID=A0A8H6HNB4_9AGAR|nr:hypothetical protein DFP72DRAFT_554654 [Tulosesus angulatus]
MGVLLRGSRVQRQRKVMYRRSCIGEESGSPSRHLNHYSSLASTPGTSILQSSTSATENKSSVTCQPKSNSVIPHRRSAPSVPISAIMTPRTQEGGKEAPVASVAAPSKKRQKTDGVQNKPLPESANPATTKKKTHSGKRSAEGEKRRQTRKVERLKAKHGVKFDASFVFTSAVGIICPPDASLPNLEDIPTAILVGTSLNGSDDTLSAPAPLFIGCAGA